MMKSILNKRQNTSLFVPFAVLVKLVKCGSYKCISQFEQKVYFITINAEHFFVCIDDFVDDFFVNCAKMKTVQCTFA